MRLDVAPVVHSAIRSLRYSWVAGAMSAWLACYWLTLKAMRHWLVGL